MASSPGETRELEIFVALIEQGGVSAGARHLGLPPSSATRALQRLESRLRVRLLVRGPGVFRITPEGERCYAAARRILREICELEQTLGDAALPKGRLRVSSSIAFGRIVVLRLLPLFSTEHPDIVVDLNLTDRIVDLQSDEADVAIRVGPLVDSDLRARKLGESSRILVASPGYLSTYGTPTHPCDLDHHNCITLALGRAPSPWPFIIRGTYKERQPVGLLSVDNGEALAQLALGGHGIARVGRFHIADALGAGLLVTLLDEFSAGETESIHCLFLGGTQVPGRIRVFVDFLARSVAPNRL